MRMIKEIVLMMMTLNLMSSHNPRQLRCFFYPQSSEWAIVALQLNVSDVKYVVGSRCTFFDTYIFIFVINAHELRVVSPTVPSQRSHKVLSSKIKKSIPAMAPGVRNSKRVRVATQSNVLPSELEKERSKRLHVHDARVGSDDNTAAKDANGTSGHENSTSEEGNVTAGDDNAVVDQDIGATANENTIAEGKFFSQV
jgi:hypothetical protein